MDTSQNWIGFSLASHGLLEAFSTAPHHGGAEEGGLLETAVEPKLEDFLGGCAEQGMRFSGSGDAADPGAGAIYDSDLKTIAAGFLRGVPTEQHEPEVSSKAIVPTDSRKTVDTFGQRTSIYRGVTRHRWTGRYEAHLWDNSCRRQGQSRKGRQVYLGGYDKEEKAARAYDLAALKYWGPTTTTNFSVSDYEKELEEMKNMTRQEFVASLRRKSSGFSRGASIYRGVTRHHQHGRWQARIGRVAGNKDLYLGTFSTQEEAAEAYDIAAIKFRGLNAVTNFNMSRYDVKSIISSNLPIGGMAGKTLKASESSSSSSADAMSADAKQHMEGWGASSIGLSALPIKQDKDYWSILALHHQQQQQSNQASSFGVYSGATMDFSAAASIVLPQGGSFVWTNGVVPQQHENQELSQNSSSSSIPYATALSPGGDYEASNYVGNWVAPASSFYRQTAKPNIGFFQTPIYGME